MQVSKAKRDEPVIGMHDGELGMIPSILRHGLR